MFTSSILHEKSGLVNLLFSLQDVDCPFRKAADSCCLKCTAKLTTQERYSRLQAMNLDQLERLYQQHCRCAQKG